MKCYLVNAGNRRWPYWDTGCPPKRGCCSWMWMPAVQRSGSLQNQGLRVNYTYSPQPGQCYTVSALRALQITTHITPMEKIYGFHYFLTCISPWISWSGKKTKLCRGHSTHLGSEPTLTPPSCCYSVVNKHQRLFVNFRQRWLSLSLGLCTDFLSWIMEKSLLMNIKSL